MRISHCYGELFQFSFDFLIGDGSSTKLCPRVLKIEFLITKNMTFYAVLKSVLHYTTKRLTVRGFLYIQDFLYIYVAFDPSEFISNSIFSDFFRQNFSFRISEAFFSYLTVRIDFFAVCAEAPFPFIFVSSLHRFHIFAAYLFEVRRFRNVAWSAVARQIDYVLAKGILRRVPNHPSSPFYTCHSRTHVLTTRSEYVVFTRVVAFFSIPSSLFGAPLQKLQRVSTKSTNHSIIKSVSALHGYRGVATLLALKFTPRRNRQNDETRVSRRYARIIHNDFIRLVQLSVTTSLIDNASLIKKLFFNLFICSPSIVACYFYHGKCCMILYSSNCLRTNNNN